MARFISIRTEEHESVGSVAPSVNQPKQTEPQGGRRYSPRDSYTPTDEPERYNQTKPTGTGRQSAAESTNRFSPSMEMVRFSPIEPESRPVETDIPYDPASGGDYVRRENRTYDPDQVPYDPAEMPYDPAQGAYDPDEGGYNPTEAPYNPEKEIEGIPLNIPPRVRQGHI